MSVTLDRFVRVLSGGMVVSDKLIEVRNAKVAEALAILKAQIARLQAAGLRSTGWESALQVIERDRAAALKERDNQAKSEALESVKNGARTAAAEATKAVDAVLAAAAVMAQAKADALAAIATAEAAMAALPAQSAPQLGSQLADVHNRCGTLGSTDDGDQLATATAGLKTCAAEAARIATAAAELASLLAQRSSIIAEIDHALGSLADQITHLPQQLLNRANSSLDAMRLRRDVLADAGAAELQGQLDKAPALLKDIRDLSSNVAQQVRAAAQTKGDASATTQGGDQPAVTDSPQPDAAQNAQPTSPPDDETARRLEERTRLLGEIDKELASLLVSLVKVVDPPLSSRTSSELEASRQQRDVLANAGVAELEAELQKGWQLRSNLQGLASTVELYVLWGHSRSERITAATACTSTYPQAAKKRSLDWLSNESADIAGSLQDLESQCPDDPQYAIDEWRPLSNRFWNLKGRFQKEMYAKDLTAKVKDLQSGDPSSPEARLPDAFSDPDEFMRRVLEVYHTAMVFGANLNALSPGEMAAIYTYTANDYQDMNGVLLNIPLKTPPDDTAERRDQAGIKNEQTVRAVSKLPTFPPGITKRGESGWPGADAQYAEGNSFTIRQFWSTGVGFNFPGIYQISVHGKTGRNVANMSAFPAEAEVLFLPGTTFRVLSNKKDASERIFVVVQEV